MTEAKRRAHAIPFYVLENILGVDYIERIEVDTASRGIFVYSLDGVSVDANHRFGETELEHYTG